MFHQDCEFHYLFACALSLLFLYAQFDPTSLEGDLPLKRSGVIGYALGRGRLFISAPTDDLMAKLDQLAKKHGIKIVGGWGSMPEHLSVGVYDAPNMEALLKFSMEPEAMIWSGYNTTTTRPVLTFEESMKLMK